MFYRSLRVGKNGDTFWLYKFRTMSQDGGSPTAASDDPRLTRVGRFLRRTKLDELPTLYNVLKGDITLVGPRPDVPSEVMSLDKKTRDLVLSVKPGLISPATLWNFNEDELLRGEKDAHKAYCEKIKAKKYQLNCWYVENRNWVLDLKIILFTILRFFGIKLYDQK